MDRREDAGEFYPDGKVISTRPVATGGDVKHSDFADVEPLPERFTDEDVRSRFNQLVNAAKGASAAVVALLLGAAAFGAGVTVQTAPKGQVYNDEQIVTNVIFDATGLATTGEVESVRVELGSVSNDVEALRGSIDYSPSNETLVATIEATSPAESDPVWESEKDDYATVWDLDDYATVWDIGDLDDRATALEAATNDLTMAIGGALDEAKSYADGRAGEVWDSLTPLTFNIYSAIGSAATDSTNHTDGVAASIRTEVGSVSNDVSTLSDTVATLSAEIAPAVTAYPRVYAFMTGSTNANFVVTNYQLTAEADAERTHFDPSDPDLDFSTVPSSLRLEDFSTGTNRVVVDARDWTVWYYACKIGSAIHTAYTTAVETCRAWAGFTATGLENPVPDTLIVDVPNIWLLADKTFEKHVAISNACWVIRSKDTVMPISDNAQSAGGFLELTDAFGEPYIRFNKTESYFVDPQAEGITNTNGTWYVVYPTQSQPKGGANAVIEGSTTYPGKAVLKAEDDPDCPATITWTGGAGHWVMVAVPKLVGGVYPSKMFFGAVVEVQGQDYIEYLRPMSIPHLLVDGVKISPQIPASHPTGTSITWKVVE